MKALDLFREVVALRHEPRRLSELLDSTAPVMGFLDTGFPEELAIAAGYRTMLLTADIERATPNADEYLDLGTSDRVRFLTESMITDRFAGVDALCVVGGDRWISGMQHFLFSYAQLTGKEIFLDVHYMERVRGSYRQHRTFTLQTLIAYRTHLQSLTGCEVTDESIVEAVRVTNRTRALLRRMRELRRGPRPQVTSVDAHTITMAAMLMPKGQFNDAASRLLDHERDSLVAPAAGAPRVFLSGSSLDHDRLHAIIDAVGGVVVGEDTEFGDAYCAEDVDELVDPLEAIADRHTFTTPAAWRFDRDRRIAGHVEAAAAALPDVEVFLHIAGDNAVGWDFPDQRDALSARGIPVLGLSDRDFALRNVDSLASEIASFLDAHSAGHAQREQAGA